jgi:C-terminal processing protease CtpA/Prc
MRIIAPSGHARRLPGAALRSSARIVVSLLRVFALAALLLVASCFSGKGTIGAVIAQDADSGRLFLRQVPPNLAAAQANLKPGDEILLIDGLDVRRMSAQQINDALSGEVDSPVKLTVIRQEQVLRVTLKRTEAHRLAKKPVKSPESGP